MNKSKEKNKKNISPNKQSDNNDKKQPPKFNIYWIYGIIAISFIAITFWNSGGQMQEITWQRFEREMLQNRDVAKITIVNKERAEIYIKRDALDNPRYEDITGKGFAEGAPAGPHYFFNIGSVEIFNEELDNAQEDIPKQERVPVAYETRKDVFGEMLSWFLPIIIIVIIWLIIFKRLSAKTGGGPGNIFSVGKSKAKLFDKESNVKIDFSNVAGLEEAKTEVQEVVEFLKNPDKYKNLGGKIPKGALLIGPPGTGKTLMAKAVAGEANVPFFSMSGSDFVEMFVGVGASRVRDLFKQAKEKAPCIIFIDEIDAIGRARGKNPNMGANDERENTLNQLLSEMDGFGDNSGVIILAATNRVDILDRALMRAGRFDRQIHIDLPDLNGRKEIFKVHIKPIKISKDIDIDFISRQTPGFSGADIANACNEAALIAARKNKKKVDKQDFLDAIDRIIAGLERKNKIISKLEKKTIAFHEAGHATVSWFLRHASPLVKVSIIPRGRSLGAAWYLPEERQITTTDQLQDELCAALGGRASEELNFKKVSTGALNDLERVTKQAYAMVTYFGMSDKIKNISYYDSSGQNEYTFNKPYSEKTAEIIDEEVSKIIESAYKNAKKILTDHQDGLNELADKLLEKEVIFKEDLEKIFGKRQYSEEDDEEKPLIKDENNKTQKNTKKTNTKEQDKKDTTNNKT